MTDKQEIAKIIIDDLNGLYGNLLEMIVAKEDGKNFHFVRGAIATNLTLLHRLGAHKALAQIRKEFAENFIKNVGV